VTRHDIDRLYSFNRWATARTLESVQPLSEEQLHRDLTSSFPSVFATLVHTLSADWIWLERWNGSSPTGWPEAERMKTLADLRGRWDLVEAGQGSFIATLDDAALGQRISYRNLKGDPFTDPLGDTLQHVVNHGTYHRGQIATMLRQLGAKPQGIDFISWSREAG
jgi:uncharacterized damage-inducible protein DinB